MEKFYLSKALLAGGGGVHPPHLPPPLDPLLTGTLLFQTLVVSRTPHKYFYCIQLKNLYRIQFPIRSHIANFNLFIGIAIALS